MKLKSKIKNKKSNLWRYKMCSCRRGFTLIELMIAVSITVLAMAAVYTSFIVQQRSFTVQDQVAETDTTSKIAFNILVNDIRDTGFGYPFVEGPSINGQTDIVFPAAGTGNTDNLTLVGGFSSLGNLALNAALLGGGQTTVIIGQRAAGIPYIDVCYTGTSTFDNSNMSYISIDGVTYARVTGTQATSVDCNFDGTDEAVNVARLLLDRDIDMAFPVNSTRPTPVYLIEDVTYGIDLDGNSPGELQRTGRIGMPTATIAIAQNIDDFQVAEIDQDGDGNTDRVRVNILARTAREDTDLDTATKPYAGGITLENGSAIGAGDGFRRRVWSMEVALRNPEE
jgi:prepilin-type N-terminal cleavage/methylation domain-containing protein